MGLVEDRGVVEGRKGCKRRFRISDFVSGKIFEGFSALLARVGF